MGSNQKKYNTYRLTFGEMVYESFSYTVAAEGLRMEFTFTLNDKIVFHPTATIPLRPFLNFNQPRELMDTLVFNIGMAELVSYWKCVCPKVVRVLPRGLDTEQVRFWKKLYFNGLGEFFYTNGIRATEEDFMEIVGEGKPLGRGDDKSVTLADGYLVPIGGGKDSVVTLEALRQLPAAGGAEPVIRPLIMNPRGATTLCAAQGGFAIDEVLVINRTIDPLLLDLNAKGGLNGHTPFSAMLAFYTLLAATLAGLRNVALSNESSANEPTVADSTVNHQYSKSLEFENDFRSYAKLYATAGVNYFSFLRPLSELQIAMLFAQHEKYFDVFKSCNAGSKQDIWCGHCAKCLFAYIILSPFIAPERLDAIFGKPMLDDPEMRTFFEQLTGHTASKPFECVGTISEVNTALAMTRQRWYADGKMPTLLKTFDYNGPMTSLETFMPDHNLNDRELRLLTSAVKATIC